MQLTAAMDTVASANGSPTRFPLPVNAQIMKPVQNIPMPGFEFPLLRLPVSKPVFIFFNDGEYELP